MEDQYIVKTISVKLDIPSERKEDLLETFRQFNQACNTIVDVAWKGEQKIHNKKELHRLTYYDIRDVTNLPSNLVCTARNRVAEMTKTCVTKWTQGRKASKPVFREFGSILYDKRTMTIRNRSCTLSTVGKRIKATYILGDYQRKHLDDLNYEDRSATLNYRDEKFFLNITIRRPVLYRNTGIVMGVDLGVNRIAVTSTGKFFDSGFYNWKRNGIFRTKRGLQAKGTRSSKRVLKRLKQRENRFAEDYLHNVSKDIVCEALEHDVDTIAFEQLDYIRDRMRSGNKQRKRQMHTWGFRKLQSFVIYKAAEQGIRVVFQDARYTSQKCSRCGHIHSSNREGHVFQCQACGYQLDADFNASKNIGLNSLHKNCTQGLKSAGVAPTCQLALKSGTMTPKDEFTRQLRPSPRTSHPL